MMSSNVVRQLLHANCRAVRVLHDVVRHFATINAEICVSVVAATYDIVWYVNSALGLTCAKN